MVEIVKNTKPNGIIISSHLNQLKDYLALEDPFTSKNDKGHSKKGSIECLSDNRFGWHEIKFKPSNKIQMAETPLIN